MKYLIAGIASVKRSCFSAISHYLINLLLHYKLHYALKLE